MEACVGPNTYRDGRAGLTRRGPRARNTCVIRDAQGGKASRHACAALSATTFHDMRLRRLTTINHALRSYIYRSAVRSMCPGPPADLPSAYPHLAFTRKTTNLPLCGRTHRPIHGSPRCERTSNVQLPQKAKFGGARGLAAPGTLRGAPRTPPRPLEELPGACGEVRTTFTWL